MTLKAVSEVVQAEGATVVAPTEAPTVAASDPSVEQVALDSAAAAAAPPPEPVINPAAEALFGDWDANGDGTLTRLEFRRALEAEQLA